VRAKGKSRRERKINSEDSGKMKWIPRCRGGKGGVKNGATRGRLIEKFGRGQVKLKIVLSRGGSGTRHCY